jgi:hypothetical protein
MFDDEMLVDWKRLKELGWPYCRPHTWRKIRAGSFAGPIKFGKHRGSRVAWRWRDIKGFFDGSDPRVAG